MTEQVQAYLDKHAAQDAVFAEKMRNPRKSIKNCIKYIAQKAREYMEQHKADFEMEGGYGGDIDDEICYGWANHYYDETDLEIDMTEEERKAKREKEAAERKAKMDAIHAAANTKKGGKKSASAQAPETPKSEPQKPAKKPTKAELRKGADCYSLFDF